MPGGTGCSIPPLAGALGRGSRSSMPQSCPTHPFQHIHSPLPGIHRPSAVAAPTTITHHLPAQKKVNSTANNFGDHGIDSGKFSLSWQSASLLQGRVAEQTDHDMIAMRNTRSRSIRCLGSLIAGSLSTAHCAASARCLCCVHASSRDSPAPLVPARSGGPCPVSLAILLVRHSALAPRAPRASRARAIAIDIDINFYKLIAAAMHRACICRHAYYKLTKPSILIEKE
eukprot:SAG31_NODE_1815_length_7210_cov_7.167628_1_plen_228_part_00